MQGLAKAVKLPLAGNFKDDGAVFNALVSLLSADEAPLRGSAFDGLKDAVPGGHGYNPRLPAKRQEQAIKRWRDWCREKCGA